MIPNSTIDVQELQGGLPGEQIDLSFDEHSVAHLMSILTDMYEDTIMAPIREYSTNAHDEHKACGQTKPIDITPPSRFDPFFKVRDYGRGLSVEDIREVYSKYGASTKRESNAYNGTLGIGAKSGLTYTPSYTITSIKDGIRHEVDVRRADGGGGYMKVVLSVPTDAPSGVEIKIPVKVGDVESFREKITDFFKWWDPAHFRMTSDLKVPNIKDQLKPQANSDKIFLWKDGKYNNDIVVMGNVAYPSPYDNIISNSMPVVYYADIGEAVFTRSREGLMTVDTNRNLLDSVKAHIVSEFENQATQVMNKANDKVDAWGIYYTEVQGLARQLFGYNWINTTKGKFSTYGGKNLDEWARNCSIKYDAFFAVWDNGMTNTFNPRSDHMYHKLHILNGVELFVVGIPQSARLDSSKSHDVAERGLTHLGYESKRVAGFSTDTVPDWIKDEKPSVKTINWDSIVEGSKIVLAAKRPARTPGVKKAPKPKDEFDVINVAHYKSAWNNSGSFATVREKINGTGKDVVYTSREDLRVGREVAGNHLLGRTKSAIRIAEHFSKKIVFVPESRQAKFHKEYPDAVTFTDLLKMTVEKIRAEVEVIVRKEAPHLTDAEVNEHVALLGMAGMNIVYRYNDYMDSRWVGVLKNSTSSIQDPEVVEVVEAARALEDMRKAIDSLCSDASSLNPNGKGYTNLISRFEGYRYSKVVQDGMSNGKWDSIYNKSLISSIQKKAGNLNIKYPLADGNVSHISKPQLVVYFNAMYEYRRTHGV